MRPHPEMDPGRRLTSSSLAWPERSRSKCPNSSARAKARALEFGHFSDWTSSHTASICGEQHEEARMFSLDKLKVCDKALANAASLAQQSRSWDKRHAVTDQLLRASESFVLNLAEGARLRRT
jgi:hypothetical protein